MQVFKTKVLIVIASLCSLCSYPVFADNTASTTVSVAGDIIASLSLSVDETVRFGEVAVDPTTAPSAQITVTDQSTGAFSVAYTNNGSPDASADTTGIETIISTHNRVAIGPGKVTVAGQPNYHYIATSANFGFATMVPPGPTSMRIDTFSGSRVFSGAGSDTFYLGGVFTVNAGAPVGDYTGTIDITATYD